MRRLAFDLDFNNNGGTALDHPAGSASSSRCGCLPDLPTTVPGAAPGLVQRSVLLWRRLPHFAVRRSSTVPWASAVASTGSSMPNVRPLYPPCRHRQQMGGRASARRNSHESCRASRERSKGASSPQSIMEGANTIRANRSQARLTDIPSKGSAMTAALRPAVVRGQPQLRARAGLYHDLRLRIIAPAGLRLRS
jgi:hypothetical protein